MNFEIIFSTYVNRTGQHTGRAQLEQDLVDIAKSNGIEGFSLRDQLGYWAGELEQSHILELLGTNKTNAFKVAKQLKDKYHQDAVIIRPVEQTVYFV